MLSTLYISARMYLMNRIRLQLLLQGLCLGNDSWEALVRYLHVSNRVQHWNALRVVLEQRLQHTAACQGYMLQAINWSTVLCRSPHPHYARCSMCKKMESSDRPPGYP